MQTHGLSAQCQRGFSIAEIRTAHRRVDEHVRVVGVQAQGPVNVKRGLIEATAIQVRPSITWTIGSPSSSAAARLA